MTQVHWSTAAACWHQSHSLQPQPAASVALLSILDNRSVCLILINNVPSVALWFPTAQISCSCMASFNLFLSDHIFLISFLPSPKRLCFHSVCFVCFSFVCQQDYAKSRAYPKRFSVKSVERWYTGHGRIHRV